MIKIKLDIWVEDRYTKMKLPSDGRFPEAMQIFAENEKDRIKLEELSKKFMTAYGEMKSYLENMGIG